MIITSIDTETTGLNPESDQLLSIGVVIEDTNNLIPIDELPKIHIAIIRENISGSMFAINMNRDLIKNIVTYKELKTDKEKSDFETLTKTKYLKEEFVVEELFKFFWDNGVRSDEWESFVDIFPSSYPPLISNMKKIYLNVAGKNFANIDKPLLEKLPRWKQVFFIKSRIIDPAILFVDWKNDDALPGLDVCKRRANIGDDYIHIAIDDAIDVIKLLRVKNYK